MGHLAPVLILAACSPDLPENPPTCDARPLEAGEVRARRIPCIDELIAGGEGAVGDWLLENAQARFVVRGTYAALTQHGRQGGSLVDAARVGQADLLMELLPDGDRSEIEAVSLAGAAELRLPGVVYHLDADDDRLVITTSSDAALWVPKPSVEHVDAVARSGTQFMALMLGSPLPAEADGYGQIEVAGLTGVALSAASRWAGGERLPTEVEADVVEVSLDGRIIDRVPVVDGVATVVAPGDATLTGKRAGCTYAGLALVGCAGLAVVVRDDDGRDIAATVHFGDDDFPLPVGGGRAPLGVTPGKAWAWAGPGYASWAGWYDGEESQLTITLARVMPEALRWGEGEGAEDWPEGGLRLAAFGVEVAPDADRGQPAADVLHQLAAEGVGYANLLADEEFPAVKIDGHDDVLVSSGARTAGDVWTWGSTANPRRPAHGALDSAGFGALDRATLSRGGIAADKFVVARPEWVAAALAEAPPWDWPTPPDALWLDSLADLPVLVGLAAASIDVQPLAERVWLPHVGAANPASLLRALAERQASAGNGPLVEIAFADGAVAQASPAPLLLVVTGAPGWMGTLSATLHTDLGARPFELDAEGGAVLALPVATWALVSVTAERSRPWGGDPAWAVTPVRWVPPG